MACMSAANIRELQAKILKEHENKVRDVVLQRILDGIHDFATANPRELMMISYVSEADAKETGFSIYQIYDFLESDLKGLGFKVGPTSYSDPSGRNTEIRFAIAWNQDK